MSDSNNYNEDDSMFNDFSILENEDTEIDEDAIEEALRKIAAQMSGAPEEYGQEAQASSENAQDSTSEEISAQTEEELPVQESEAAENIKEEIPLEEETNKTEDIKETPEEKTDTETVPLQKEESKPPNKNEEPEKQDIQDKTSKAKTNDNDDLSDWEEVDDSNSVVKKYVVYISKEFIPYIDDLSTDERSAYINDAIQQKIDNLDENKQFTVRKNAMIHAVIAISIVVLLTPVALLIAHKAIMATFENYKYSQENFEQLYKHRFEKDKAYMRSVQYNQNYQKRLKEGN